MSLDHRRKEKDKGRRRKGACGFTLVELLIAMAVGLIVLAAIYGVFTLQNKELKTQEQIA
jgi:prepilin-type N-terminal cleavage/methylation domain-containing protein